MLRGALLGFAVMVIAALIPILHFITGPHLLGGFIGGFVGGSRAKASARTALGIGGLMALLALALAAPVLALLTLAFHVIPAGDRDFYWALAIGGSLWIGVQGTAGALVGGYTSRRGAATKPSPPLLR